jgi:hypothetical protein
MARAVLIQTPITEIAFIFRYARFTALMGER